MDLSTDFPLHWPIIMWRHEDVDWTIPRLQLDLVWVGTKVRAAHKNPSFSLRSP